MIAKDYRQNKEDVLSLYRAYEEFCKQAGVPVGESLKAEAQKIENDVFNLMVLGEAKSGKSTFINAYLGAEVVPMDILQCTSAIIKIKHGKRFELLASTAGGAQTHMQGKEKIQEFLKNHAAISDEYRSIPVSTINDELLITYKNKKIPEHVIRDFVANEKENNVYRLPEDEYNECIRKYIRESQKNWQNIITEIEISYPLPEDMRTITIIDSPGVGAKGSVGKIAKEYLTHAHAIIFVKSLSGQALESELFTNFFDNVCQEKQKESLFLAFTRKADIEPLAVLRLKENAIKLYQKAIDEDRLLFVDSKIQFLLNQCLALGAPANITEYFDRMEAEGNNYDPAEKCWLKCNNDVSKFKTMMEEKSSFANVYDALDKFARKAHYIRLMAFVKAVEREYESCRVRFSSALKTATENFKDPVALERAIEKRKEELDEVYSKINEGVDEICNNYVSTDGKVHQRADELKRRYVEKLNRIVNRSVSENPKQSVEKLKKMTFEEIEAVQDVRSELARQFLEECNERLIRCTDDPDSIPTEAYLPNFTAGDFAQINSMAEENAFEYREITKFVTLTDKEMYFSTQKYVTIFAESIRSRLDTEIVRPMQANVIAYVGKCREVYIEKLTERKKALEQEYDRLLQSREDNEMWQHEIDRLERNLSLIKANQRSTESVKGVLSNYVGS